MRIPRTLVRLSPVIVSATSRAGFRSSPSCAPKREGSCRDGIDVSGVEICTSGKWQVMDTGQYRCVAGVMVPLVAHPHVFVTAATPGTSSSLRYQAPDRSTSILHEPSALVPLKDTTGNAYCSHTTLQPRLDQWGQATFRPGGKMASTYVADAESVFRCNAAPPSDGYYVAFWTQYRALPDGSQPQPLNCNRTMQFTNPRLGRTATAVVIDRCASCVGVGRQLHDPTTGDCFVNGATVDLSTEIWQYLFAGAPGSVYDIEYDGVAYAGWDTEPAALTNLSFTQCAC